MPIPSGVYHIFCSRTGKGYVGSSVDISARWSCHRCQLRSAYHKNPHLQSSWTKYGENAFQFSVLARCPKEYLTKLEQWFKDKSSLDASLNIRPDCASNLGHRLSDQAKELLRLKATGRKLSLKARSRCGKHLIGKKLTQDHRHKCSLKLRGEGNCKAKITEVQAQEIILALGVGEHPDSIASRYPISSRAVYEIRSGRSWKHLPR